jgi:hypothetical protein
MSGRTSSLSLGVVEYGGERYRVLVTAPKGQKLSPVSQKAADKATKRVQQYLSDQNSPSKPVKMSSQGLAWNDGQQTTSNDFGNLWGRLVRKIGTAPTQSLQPTESTSLLAQPKVNEKLNDVHVAFASVKGEIENLQYQLDVRKKIFRNLDASQKEPLNESEKAIENTLYRVHTGKAEDFKTHLANHIAYVEGKIKALQGEGNKSSFMDSVSESFSALGQAISQLLAGISKPTAEPEPVYKPIVVTIDGPEQEPEVENNPVNESSFLDSLSGLFSPLYAAFQSLSDAINTWLEERERQAELQRQQELEAEKTQLLKEQAWPSTFIQSSQPVVPTTVAVKRGAPIDTSSGGE